jgi:hypothetical protein
MVLLIQLLLQVVPLLLFLNLTKPFTEHGTRSKFNKLLTQDMTDFQTSSGQTLNTLDKYLYKLPPIYNNYKHIKHNKPNNAGETRAKLDGKWTGWRRTGEKEKDLCDFK